jgi:predicted protein tyrosine phosphatase
MTLIVCPLHEVDGEIARSRPARLVSLIGPEQEAPKPPADVAHLVLHCHDITAPDPGLIAPHGGLIEQLLDFGATWTEPGPLLVHCWMGISRSTAGALALACAAHPARPELEIAAALRQASPTATPNPLIVALADDLLAREGRLIAAAASIGRGELAASGVPFRFKARPL